MSATEYSAARAQAFEAWHEVCGIELAAFRLSNLIGHHSNIERLPMLVD
jgi:hypothetical protein